MSRSTVDAIDAIQDLLQPKVFKTTNHYQVDHSFKRTIHNFNDTDFKWIEILHITDIQFGHKMCNVKRVEEYRDWILAKPYRFMVWGGDMVDAGTKISRHGSPWEQMWEPQGQLYEFSEMWAPAAHRVLGYVGGNHERHTEPSFGELGRSIASMLKVPYSPGQQLVDINFGDHRAFRIHLWHGAGSSVTPGAKMQMLARFMERGDSQLYLVGHLHEPMVRFLARPLRQKDGGIKLIKVGGAMSSSFLEYYGTYAEVMNLSSAPLMMARTVLERNGHWELTLR